MTLQFGIDNILKKSPNWKQKRIGFLTNHAATTNTGILSRLALIQGGFNVVALFSPEHGIKANATDGAFINDGKDDITGLPIISLYGDKFIPTANDLTEIDIMIFDIPDAGTRFYTYLWSMTYWIEAAAKFNKKILILDRPNPLGGNLSNCEGPMLNEKVSSFIGRFNIPVKHQCTLGELAHYFNATQNWKADLEIIKCSLGNEFEWNRDNLFFDWHLPWVNPSPALQNMEATLLYPGLCFFEATNVSVGRGTPYSFEWIGAEWFNLNAIKMVCQNIVSDDFKIEIVKLNIKHNGQQVETKGIRIKVIDPYHFDSVLNGLLLVKVIRDIHPQYFKWMPYPTNANPSGENHLSFLLGISNAENIFDLPLQQWLQQISKLLKVDDWKKEVTPYLLYK
jgi:uncharacterized protein YbbC (DUF1343 family)